MIPIIAFIVAVIVLLAVLNLDAIVSYAYHYELKIKNWYHASKEYKYYDR